MKGADQCPACASRRFRDITLPDDLRAQFYAVTIRACVNCRTIWEPFAVADLLDADDKTSSFKEPCDNCAFRPGSFEQSDAKRWAELMTSLKTGGGGFHCHKGVPIKAASEHGFAYPADRDGKPIRNKLRLCRGWLRMIGAQWDKEFKRETVSDQAG